MNISVGQMMIREIGFCPADSFCNRQFMKMTKVKKRLLKPTTTEVNIIQLLSEGNTHDDIAIALELSKRTIDGYIGLMFRKFDVRNACQLVTLALKLDWID